MFLFFFFTIASTIVSPLFVIGVKRNRNAGSSSVRRRSDGAQSRVEGMLLRVDAIVRISNCLNGVLDFLLPLYIQSFLLLYPKFRVVSSSSSADEREQLLPYKRHLGSIVKKRLSAAVNRRDGPTILRLIKLCKPLGLEEESFQVFVRYLKQEVSKRSRERVKQLVQLMETPNNDSEVDFVACLRGVLLEIVLAVEQNDEILRDLRGDEFAVEQEEALLDETFQDFTTPDITSFLKLANGMCGERLGSIIKKRLSAAVNRRHRPTILRLIKLCKPLGLEEESFQVFVRYLKKDVSKRSRERVKQLVQVMETPNNDTEVDFVACLRGVLLEIVLAIEQNYEILRDLRGDDGIVHAICELQKGCDIRCCEILERFIKYRELREGSIEISLYKRNMEGRDIDAIEIDARLQEILSFAQLH